jgi:metal-responsive CopG/Arc/MetJ family transcriptional regulator
MAREKNQGRPKKKASEKYAKVTLTIPKNLLSDWNEVLEMYSWTKSRMLQDLLRETLPVLKEQTPDGLLKAFLKKSTKFQKKLIDEM